MQEELKNTKNGSQFRNSILVRAQETFNTKEMDGDENAQVLFDTWYAHCNRNLHVNSQGILFFTIFFADVHGRYQGQDKKEKARQHSVSFSSDCDCISKKTGEYG